ncbi:hypothetical protein RIF29_05913 [Crotalaria pallida]|uniref:Uncharacterized protein n=1 Tax=Crotalaria pallida TaxID=3830 RepID=A0AAN9PA13_CROPI
MEDENVNTKKHPSLPPNYVTIFDLKQRWFQQKQLEKEEAQREERQRRDREEAEARRKEREQQKERAEEERREPVVVIRTMFTDGTHRYVKKIEYRRALPGTDSGSNSRRIERTSGGDGGNADLDGKGEELKEKKKMGRWEKRNLKVMEKKEKEATSSEVKKSAIESELNEEKEVVKGNPNVEEEEKRKNETIEKSESKKSTIESELNEDEVKNAKGNPNLEEKTKNVDSKVEEAEEKIGGLYVKSRDGNQSWRIRRVNEGRGNQQWRRGNFEGKKSAIDAKKNATNFDAKKSAIQRKTLRSADENVGGKKESGELGNSDKAKKSAIENELDEGMKVDSAVGEIGEKFGGLSVKPGNGNRSWGWRFKRLDEGFGQYGHQSQRRGNNEYYFSGRRHGFPRHDGFRGLRHGFPRHDGFGDRNDEENKMVWVKKIGNSNGSVGGEIES